MPAEHQGQGHVQLEISFPPGSAPDAEALAHLVDRLALPEAVLSFGVDTLLAHPSLSADGSCVRHVQNKDPFFGVLAVTQQGSTVKLDLSPSRPQDAFHYLSFSLQHSPDAAAEVERRRSLGLWTGRQLAIKYEESITAYAINWNGNPTNPGAKEPKLPVFPAPNQNALYCKDCFFYLGATLNINVQVCAILQLAQVIYYYDADMPKTVVDKGSGYWYSYAYTQGSPENPGLVASDAAARASTDCAADALNTPMYASYTFNLGFSAEVFFTGTAAFNFQINSDGIKETLKFPSSCSRPSMKCIPEQLLEPMVIKTIVLTVAGIPVTIDPTITLSAAAVADLSMPDFRLQFGAGAKVTLKLGGKASFTEVPSSWIPNVKLSAYSEFAASYNQVPFILSGFTNVAGSIDATIVPVIDVTVWKVIPFTMKPNYNMIYSLGASTTTSRQLGLRGDEHERALQSCTSGQVSTKAEAMGSLGVKLKKITAFGMIKSATGVDIAAKQKVVSDFTVLDEKTLVDQDKVTFATSGAVASAASACVAVGSSIGGGGSISAGGGGSGSGRGSGSGGSSASGTGAGSSGGSAGLTGGALIGVIVGCVVLLLIIIGVVVYFVFVRKGKATPAGGVISSKNPAAAAASDGGGRKAKSPRAGV